MDEDKSKKDECIKKEDTDKSYWLIDIKYKNPWIAVLLNLIIPGAGFLYMEEYAKAVLSFIIVLLAVYFGGLFIGVIALVFIIVWSLYEVRKHNKRVNLKKTNP